MRFSRIALCCALTLGCDLGGEVGHDGQYGFFQPAGLPGTTARPLECLLVLEADETADRTLFYVFEGELGKAGIGVEDLRGVARRFSRYEMRFGMPPESYALPEDTEPEVAPETVELVVDGELTPLSVLTSDALVPTGASRFAPTLGNVRAYFGVRRSAADFAKLELDSAGGKLVYTPELAASALEIERSESELRVEYGSLVNPDYLEIDFFQPIVRKIDGAELDGSLWISLFPEWPAIAGNAALESAFSQGCWDVEEPLSVRVTQTARSYRTGKTSDVAVISRRLDVAEVAPETWSSALELPELLPDCEGFSR